MDTVNHIFAHNHLLTVVLARLNRLMCGMFYMCTFTIATAITLFLWLFS
jgi:hypothetical protein